MNMKPYKGFIYGFLTATCLALVVGNRYGAYRQKLGLLQGFKKGEVSVAQFLENHFPPAKSGSEASGPTCYLKWYTLVVVTSNSVPTLRVTRKM